MAFWKINYYKFYPCLKWANQRAVLHHVLVEVRIIKRKGRDCRWRRGGE